MVLETHIKLCLTELLDCLGGKNAPKMKKVGQK